MRNRDFAYNVGGFAGCLFFLFVFALALCLGPICLAYDLNHLVPLLTNKPLNVSPWQLPVFIGGVFLSETAVPVAIVVWILVTIGVLV